MSLNFRSVQFLTSATKVSECPTDLGSEVVFCGRSNAGKSSAINALTGNRSLAKTSKTPGRTQMINFFSVSCEKRIVDLPGYGYAKLSKQGRNEIKKLIHGYFEKRKQLINTFVLIDSRHKPQKIDTKIVVFFDIFKFKIVCLIFQKILLRNSL